MTTQVNIPEWLPLPIAEVSYRMLTASSDPETKRIILLLTTREEMKLVWNKLSKNKIQPKGNCNLIFHIFSSLGHWDFMEEEGLLLPPKEQEKIKSEITHAIDNLRSVLKKHHHHIWKYNLESLSPIDMELDSVEQGLEYTFFWDEFPTKIKAKTAKKTFLSKRLKSFMKDAYQQPFHAEIATIIGLIFDDEEITDAHIRGL